MTNYIPSDNGNMVLAEGTPGSVTRARVQYPSLIEKLKALRRNGSNEIDAHFVCASSGVNNTTERNAVIAASSFPSVVHPIEFNI